MRTLKMQTLFFLFATTFLLMAGCDDDPIKKNQDTIAPTVLTVNPADLAAVVPINTQVSATFSEEMDPLTLTTSTFTLNAGANPVAGTVAYTGTMATFTPNGVLAGDTLHTARITTSAKDLAGNALEATFVWTFTTGLVADVIAPTVIAVLPANLAVDLPTNSLVSATFSEEMDPLTLTTESFTLSGANPVTGTVTYSGTTATFTPAANLAPDTLFTATITTTATDASGNPLALNHVWTFTTGAQTPILLPVDLGEAAHFAVLAGYAITNVPASDITGDVGLSPAAESFITGFSQTDYTGYALSPQVTGSIFASDMASPTPTMLTLAKGDLTLAYNDAAGRTPTPTGTFLNPGVGNLAGLNLVPGLYKFTGAAIATADFTLTGSATDVWIFQIASSLTISNGVHVTLAGGARPSNIFWQVGTEANLGTTVQFSGTIMADASITMDTGASLDGRALAFTGTIALDQCQIVIP